jgi:hypothetical protein
MRRLPGAVTTALVATVMIAIASGSARAQESLLPNSSWALAPTFLAWHFATPIPQAEGSLKDVQQFALPFRARTLFGDGWSFDAAGAVSTSSVQIENAGTSKTLTLSGLSDVKLRLSGALAGDKLVMTAGVNVPTGTTGLTADQTTVLQMIGAPALHMSVGALGLGPGATLGFVSAHESGDWALAFGASLEERTEYTPIELALASGSSATKVTPGSALHVTAGADRAAGENRLSLLFVADAYAKDRLSVGQADGSSVTSSYTLGPQFMALGRLDVAASGWRDATADLALRYRSAYSDQSGASVAGSSGTYVEASLSGVRGGVTGSGLILGVDARYHTGLRFTEALVGAATTAAGATVGWELPAASSMVRLAVRSQYATFSTGAARSTGFGFSLMGAVSARREAR